MHIGLVSNSVAKTLMPGIYTTMATVEKGIHFGYSLNSCPKMPTRMPPIVGDVYQIPQWPNSRRFEFESPYGSAVGDSLVELHIS